MPLKNQSCATFSSILMQEYEKKRFAPKWSFSIKKKRCAVFSIQILFLHTSIIGEYF